MAARKMKGTWWVDFRFEGERIRKKSPVDNKRGAEEYERNLRQQLLDGTYNKKEVPTFKNFSAEFMDGYVKSNNKPSEQDSKRYILDKHLLPVLRDHHLDEIGLREVESMKAKLVAAKKKPKTVNNVLAVLGRILHYAVESGVLAKAPRMKLLKVPPQRFDFLVDEDYRKLRDANAVEPDVLTAILVACDAGLRRGEILGLHWEDVDARARRLTVRRSEWGGKLMAPKGGRERTIPMTERLASALVVIRHLRGPRVFCREDGSRWTWEVMRAALPRACERAGIRRIFWHALRHTFCSSLAIRGAPPKAIQELAGHVSLTTTLKYMHLGPRVLDTAISLLEADVEWAPNGHRQKKGGGTPKDSAALSRDPTGT